MSKAWIAMNPASRRSADGDSRLRIENPVRTQEGRPILLTIEDACAYTEIVDSEPTSVECSTCRYFRHTPGSLLGVCHNEKMRSGTGNPSGPGAHKEEMR